MADLAGDKVAYLGFTGPIEPQNVSRLCQHLNAAVNNSFDSIYLCISTPGGYVADGFYLYNHMRGLPIPITVHNTGSIASMGVVAFLAGQTRICSQHGRFLMHPTSMPPDPAGMNWERLRAGFQGAVQDEDRVDAVIKERATVPDQVLSSRRVVDVHLSADEAVDFGLAHSIAEFVAPKGVQIFQV